ncbi:MAG: cytochrome C [Sulfurovum sp.]|nr:MAG: cytochrome C [Sulfurovum sp.]
MKKSLLIILLSLLGDANTSMEVLYLKNACHSCHGVYGEGMGNAPKLQGVNEKVLLQRLKNLQQGKTRFRSGEIMISFAKALDANQTIQMSKYLSTLKTKIDTNRYDTEYDPSGDGGS